MHKAKLGAAVRTAFAVLTTVVVALMTVACISSSPSGGSAPAPSGGAGAPAATTPNTIMIKDFSFGAADITVTAGAKVTVVNQDTATHTVTATDNAFDTGNIAGGKSGEFTAPSKPGRYPFNCTPHPYMTGTLVVT